MIYYLDGAILIGRTSTILSFFSWVGLQGSPVAFEEAIMRWPEIPNMQQSVYQFETQDD